MFDGPDPDGSTSCIVARHAATSWLNLGYCNPASMTLVDRQVGLYVCVHQEKSQTFAGLFQVLVEQLYIWQRFNIHRQISGHSIIIYFNYSPTASPLPWHIPNPDVGGTGTGVLAHR
jgi:hypothetical protein